MPSQNIERELSSLDNLLQALSGIGDVAMLIVDFRIARVSNPALGYSTDEILGLENALDLVEPDDRAVVSETVRGIGVSMSAPRRIAFQARTRSGAVVPIAATLNRVRADGTDVTTLVAFDNSLRRRTESALARSEDRFRLAFDHSNIGMALVNPDGRIARVNRALSEFLGYDEPDLTTMTYMDITRPDDMREDTENVLGLLSGERVVYTMEKRFVRRDGVVVWGEATVSLVRSDDGTPLHFVLQIQDITRHKQAEETLQRITSSARCILWHATVRRADGIMGWEIHTLDEDAAQRIVPLDIAPGNDYAMQWYLSRLPEDNVRADEIGHAAILRGDSHYRNEFRCRDKRGTIVWLSEDVYVEPVADDLWRCVGVCTDITEAKRAQASLVDDARRQSSLARITERAVAESDAAALTRFVLEEMARTLNADTTTVSELLGDDRTLILTTAFPGSATPLPFYMDDEHSLAGWALRTARPLVIRDAASEPLFDPIYLRQEGYASGVAVPMAQLGHPYGALGVYSVAPRTFASDEIQYCETAANVLLSAIEEIRTRRYSALQRAVADTLIRSDDVAEAIASVVRAISETLGADYGACWLVDAARSSHDRIASHSADAADPEFVAPMERLALDADDATLRALRDAHEALWRSYHDSANGSPRFEFAKRYAIQTAIYVPVALPGALIGMIEVYHRQLLRRDPRLLALLTDCGSLVADFLRRVRAQRELSDVNALLEQRVAERTALLARTNADLEQFAYVAAHDLQTPLRNVTSFVQLLHRRYHGKLDARADEYINFAVDGAVRMQRLLHGLLSYASIGTAGAPFQWVDVADAFREALRHVSPIVRSLGAQITNSALPSVFADRSQIVRVFRELLDNALKFRRNGPVIHVAATRRANDVLFSMTDNGIGVERQYWERVFVMFSRLHTSSEYPGTGVGLSLCKRIVERHGGAIWVESVVGVETTFFFTIPVRAHPS